MVERSLAWLLGFCRLGTRYGRRADLLQRLLDLACALVCLTFLAPDAGPWWAGLPAGERGCRQAPPSGGGPRISTPYAAQAAPTFAMSIGAAGGRTRSGAGSLMAR